MKPWLALMLLPLVLGCAELPPDSSLAAEGDAPETGYDSGARLAPADDPLARQIDALVEEAGGRSQVGVLVASLEDGRHLYERQHRTRARPASTLKLVTCGAVTRLGHLDRTVETRLEVLPGGDWVLRGGGDPFLSKDDLESLAMAVQEAGLSLEGALLADPHCFRGRRFGQGWMWDDEPAAYMPHLSGLSVDGGTVEVIVTGREGEPAVDIHPGGQWIPTELVPASRAAITRDWEAGRNLVRVLGNPGPGKTLRRRITVVDPDLHAAHVLLDALRRRGRARPETPVRRAALEVHEQEGRLLARHQRSVASIVRRTLVDSDNLGAECLLRLLGLWAGAPHGDAASGLKEVARWTEMLQFAPSDYRMVDGSGVSHYNLLAPDLLVAMLIDIDSRSELRDRFRASLPKPGEGTLRRRLRGSPAEASLRAKTGTLSGVSCLAGYISSADGEPLVFAIMTEGFVGPSAPLRGLQDGICDLLARVDTRGPR